MAEPTTHTEVPEGHGVFPPFDSQTFPSQLFWLSIIFILLYVLMASKGRAISAQSSKADFKSALRRRRYFLIKSTARSTTGLLVSLVATCSTSVPLIPAVPAANCVGD